MKQIARLTSIALVATLLALPLASCSGGGAETNTSMETRTTTLGQELIDLQAAYEKGIITKSEYDSAKEKLLKHYE